MLAVFVWAPIAFRYNGTITDCLSSLKIPHPTLLWENNTTSDHVPELLVSWTLGWQEASTMLFRWIHIMGAIAANSTLTCKARK